MMRAADVADAADVAVIGGGPAGAAVAARLASLGHDVLVLERSTHWRWRAGGVFSSPASLPELADLGLDAATVHRVARPIPAMRVETPRGVAFRLTYGAEAPGAPMAIGFDRSALDPRVLEVAAAAGARVERGAEVRRVTVGGRGPARLEVRDAAGVRQILAGVVIGADGTRSVVARDTGVARRPRLGGRIGLTWHVAEPATPEPPAHELAARDSSGDRVPLDARMVVLPDGAYCGLAPVPGDRVNVGIVLWGREHRARLAHGGAGAATSAVLQAVPPAHAGGVVIAPAPSPLEAIAGASPLGSRAARRAGRGWLLVGDAAGFLDPFTGEGLHRAFVSARLAAEVIDAAIRGSARGTPTHAASNAPPDLSAYERAMRGRFATKDLVSLLVQAFLARPRLLEHVAGRLAARERARGTMGLVMGDLVPASRALDPRFVATLLA